MEYLSNGIRVLHSIPAPWASVLAHGTTSVETVCRRVNKLAQAQGDKYVMTAAARLRAFWLQSVATFARATANPTTRANRANMYDLVAQVTFALMPGEWQSVLKAPHNHEHTETTASTYRALKDGGRTLRP